MRLAGILSVEVVGYSHLMGIGEAGTLSHFNNMTREQIDPTIADRSVTRMGDGTRPGSGVSVRKQLDGN
jgi:adenylate cyclase